MYEVEARAHRDIYNVFKTTYLGKLRRAGTAMGAPNKGPAKLQLPAAPTPAPPSSSSPIGDEYQNIAGVRCYCTANRPSCASMRGGGKCDGMAGGIICAPQGRGFWGDACPPTADPRPAEPLCAATKCRMGYDSSAPASDTNTAKPRNVCPKGYIGVGCSGLCSAECGGGVYGCGCVQITAPGPAVTPGDHGPAGCRCEQSHIQIDGTQKAAISAAGSQAVPQGNAESSDRVHVPTWALWLIGAAFTMLIAVNIGLLYVLSTRRWRPATGAAVEMGEVANPRMRAPSLQAIEIKDGGPAGLEGALRNEESVVSSPRTPNQTTAVRARSVSQEGVICLD